MNVIDACHPERNRRIYGNNLNLSFYVNASTTLSMTLL